MTIAGPLTVFERGAVGSFHLALSPDDRRKRFCCTLSDETISRYVDRLNFARDTILAVGFARKPFGVHQAQAH